MTEAEWLTCDDPMRLLAHLSCRPGDRKLLLYAVACCHGHRELLADPDSTGAVDWAERFADGDASPDAERDRLAWTSDRAAIRCEVELENELAAGRRAAADGPEAALRSELAAERAHLALRAAYFAHGLLTWEVRGAAGPVPAGAAPLLLLPPLRDIFGNPFRPAAFAPEWRTDTAVSLARQMYGSRDFGAMPILADALQDAECDNAEVLGHCRGPGPHVRGCWVMDLAGC
jgi:hypothetical protein